MLAGWNWYTGAFWLDPTGQLGLAGWLKLVHWGLLAGWNWYTGIMVYWGFLAGWHWLSGTFWLGETSTLGIADQLELILLAKEFFF